MNRREMLKGMIGCLAMAPLAGLLLEPQSVMAAVRSGNLRYDRSGDFIEPQRNIKIAREADVIVCGGGPAGFAAALASARKGARTILIESQGYLGGTWTAGLMSNMIDFGKQPGIMKELVGELKKSGAQYTAKCFDAEDMKLILEDMCTKAGVDIRLGTRVCGAYLGRGNKLELIVTESISGREAWKAKVFIDATGNGDLAAQAGCSFDLGHPESGKTQPASMIVVAAGYDEDELVAAGFMAPRGRTTEQSKVAFRKELERVGVKDISYRMPTMFAIRPGLMMLMANHQYGVDVADADNMTRHTIEARRELHHMVDALRKSGGIWKDFRIVATSAQIGIREGRRVKGIYTLSSDDLVRGARFDDAVCRCSFCVDVHALDRKHTKSGNGGYGGHGIKAKPYDIPLRSLISAEVDNLLLAGRCISGDFFAHASYRVTGSAVPIGEAAGKLAAEASKQGVMPKNIDYRLVIPTST